MNSRLLLLTFSSLTSMALAQAWKKPVAVPSTGVGDSFETLLVAGVGITPADLARHNVLLDGQPPTSTTISMWGWRRCAWTMSTPSAGEYVVSLFLTSGSRRPGRFGYVVNGAEFVSDSAGDAVLQV